MKNASFWRKDWLVGLLVSLVFFLAAGSDLMQSLERKAYDLGVLASTRVPSNRIAIIAIDDQSIANLGRWPWPREIHARLIDLLAEGQAKVVGHTVLFTEPQVEAGLGYVGQVSRWLDASSIRNSGNPAHRADLARLEALLEDAARKLDNDRKLGESLGRNGRVELAMYFEPGEPQGKPDKPLPDFVLRN
ncbi:MAG: CHASE2 domain-containing protein, partial [Hylemonella sp.]